MVGLTGQVIRVDMTETMFAKARKAQEEIGCSQVQFEYGIIEELPIADNWAGSFEALPRKHLNR